MSKFGSQTKVDLFQVGGKMCSVSILPIRKARSWLEQAQAVMESETDTPYSQKTPNDIEVYLVSIAECIASYDPEALAQKAGCANQVGDLADWILDNVQPCVAADAFERLVSVTNPFYEKAKAQEAEGREFLASLPAGTAKLLTEKAAAMLSKKQSSESESDVK